MCGAAAAIMKPAASRRDADGSRARKQSDEAASERCGHGEKGNSLGRWEKEIAMSKRHGERRRVRMDAA